MADTAVQKKRLRILIALALVFIWGNSLMPGPVSGNISETVVEVAKAVVEAVIGTAPEKPELPSIFSELFLRKMAHFSEYLVLGLLMARYRMLFAEESWKARKPVLFLTTIALGLAVCFLDETIQLFVPGRAGMVMDMWIDLAGFSVGASIMTGVMRRKERKRA